MVARPGRLTQRAEYLRVRRAGRRFATPGLVLQAAPAPGQAGFRVGFTVSRQVGNAVSRNRARRRLKAAARIVFPPHAASGLDYVVIGRQGTLTRPFLLLAGDMEQALHRLGLWRDRGPAERGRE
jgi:ribonuclease P protein component